MRKNQKDPYNPIVYLMITDFEICERQEQMVQQAYDDFRDNLDENEMVNIDSNFLDQKGSELDGKRFIYNI